MPRGSYTNPLIVQTDNLRASSKVLQKATIECREFDTIKPQKGDFAKMDFSEKDQDSTRPPEYCYLANARAIIVAIEYQTAIVGSGRPKLW